MVVCTTPNDHSINKQYNGNRPLMSQISN